ncbi:hypothetical protein PYW08_011041 [Mythimna loreyi]|uniref:Uncharacterized protein n=1 Tax=Mythimna loreyi TaxID=667449 RepID=A0ACC2Q4Y7_9NEOP|nr:hypothetical protein PYW08_011041 [Mythimna loreyi]
MEAAYAKLQKEGKNTVDNLVKWIKDSKIISESQEEMVRGFFDNSPDKENVPLEKFKEVMGKVADATKSNLDEITKKLTKSGTKFLTDAIEGAASCLTGTVKDLFKKK